MPESNHLHCCFLGLGSNLNNPIKQLNIAIHHIENLPRTQFLHSASWFQSKAWGVTEQNDFVNTVIKIRTTLTPLALLKAIKTIEYRLMQRQINKKWHARKIDIDILLYGQQNIRRSQLLIPHPLITDRSFVWKPLLQLNPILPISLKQKLRYDLKSRKIAPDLKLIKNLTHSNSHKKMR